MTLDKIVYAAIGVGVAVVGSAIPFLVNYEGRLSRLETQLGFVLGAQALSDRATPASGEEQAAASSLVGQSSAVADAIVQQCTTLMAQYSDIVDRSVLGLSVGDKGRLEALSGLIDQLGCGKLAGP